MDLDCRCSVLAVDPLWAASALGGGGGSLHLSAGLGVCICPPLPTRLAAVSLTHSLSFSGAVCAGEFRGRERTRVLSSAPGLLLLGAWRGWPPGGRPWSLECFCPDWLVLWVAFFHLAPGARCEVSTNFVVFCAWPYWPCRIEGLSFWSVRPQGVFRLGPQDFRAVEANVVGWARSSRHSVSSRRAMLS